MKLYNSKTVIKLTLNLVEYLFYIEQNWFFNANFHFEKRNNSSMSTLCKKYSGGQNKCPNQRILFRTSYGKNFNWISSLDIIGRIEQYANQKNQSVNWIFKRKFMSIRTLLVDQNIVLNTCHETKVNTNLAIKCF